MPCSSLSGGFCQNPTGPVMAGNEPRGAQGATHVVEAVQNLNCGRVANLEDPIEDPGFCAGSAEAAEAQARAGFKSAHEQESSRVEIRSIQGHPTDVVLAVTNAVTPAAVLSLGVQAGLQSQDSALHTAVPLRKEGGGTTRTSSATVSRNKERPEVELRSRRDIESKKEYRVYRRKMFSGLFSPLGVDEVKNARSTEELVVCGEGSKGSRSVRGKKPGIEAEGEVLLEASCGLKRKVVEEVQRTGEEGYGSDNGEIVCNMGEEDGVSKRVVGGVSHRGSSCGCRGVGDESSVVEGEERMKIYRFGEHWGGCGANNKAAVEEAIDRVLEDKREGMLFVSEEGDIGGLAGILSDEDHVNLGESEDFEDEEVEQDQGLKGYNEFV